MRHTRAFDALMTCALSLMCLVVLHPVFAAVGFRAYLGWTDAAGAIALAKAVSDPHSVSSGRYLTPNAGFLTLIGQ